MCIQWSITHPCLILQMSPRPSVTPPPSREPPTPCEWLSSVPRHLLRHRAVPGLTETRCSETNLGRAGAGGPRPQPLGFGGWHIWKAFEPVGLGSVGSWSTAGRGNVGASRLQAERAKKTGGEITDRVSLFLTEHRAAPHSGSRKGPGTCQNLQKLQQSVSGTV